MSTLECIAPICKTEGHFSPKGRQSTGPRQYANEVLTATLTATPANRGERRRTMRPRTSKPPVGILGDVDGRIVPVAHPPISLVRSAVRTARGRCPEQLSYLAAGVPGIRRWPHRGGVLSRLDSGRSQWLNPGDHLAARLVATLRDRRRRRGVRRVSPGQPRLSVARGDFGAGDHGGRHRTPVRCARRPHSEPDRRQPGA